MATSPKKKSPLMDRSSSRFYSPIKEAQNRSRSASVSGRDNNYCRRIKFVTQLDLLQDELIRNKNKLCSCIQIFSILENSHQTQRCLQHNNTLSLYCLNQRRILCVNCLYGLHRHRSHKVIPLKNCMEEVYEDNKKLKVIIDEELHKLEHYTKIAEDNKFIIEKELQKNLAELEKVYLTKSDELKLQYQKQRDQLKTIFCPIIQKCQNGRKQLQQFRYKVWETVARFGAQKMTDDNEIMKQILYVNLVQLCEIKCRPISKSQVQTLGRRNKHL